MSYGRRQRRDETPPLTELLARYRAYRSRLPRGELILRRVLLILMLISLAVILAAAALRSYIRPPDLPPAPVPALSLDSMPPEVSLSARTGAGLEALGEVVAALFPQGKGGEDGAVLTNARQAQAAQGALEALQEAQRGLEAGVTPDAVLTDVEAALERLGELTGRTVREDVVERIFSRFCVGK